jgi:hypothetical protein
MLCTLMHKEGMTRIQTDLVSEIHTISSLKHAGVPTSVTDSGMGQALPVKQECCTLRIKAIHVEEAFYFEEHLLQRCTRDVSTLRTSIPIPIKQTSTGIFII